MEISRLTRDGTAELVSRDHILRREQGRENINFPCSADHEQDWQPYPVDPYSYLYVMTIHKHTNTVQSVPTIKFGSVHVQTCTARDGTAELVSRDHILRHEQGRENINFPCSADHEQHWQPYPVDPYSYYM